MRQNMPHTVAKAERSQFPESTRELKRETRVNCIRPAADAVFLFFRALPDPYSTFCKENGRFALFYCKRYKV